MTSFSIDQELWTVACLLSFTMSMAFKHCMIYIALQSKYNLNPILNPILNHLLSIQYLSIMLALNVSILY